MTKIAPTTQPSKDTPLAVAAMICGILSVTGVGLILGIPAIILGIISLRRQENNRGFSITGIVTGAISTLVSLFIIAFFLWLFAMGAMVNTHDNQRPTPESQLYDSSRI